MTEQTGTPGATKATPKKERRQLYTDAKIIAALKSTNGGIYLAASRLGCDPNTIYRRADKNAKVQRVIDEMRGELVDLAEAALKRAVGAGEGWAVCFTLKTQGKQRGYVERTEHDVTVRDWREEARQNGIQNPDDLLRQIIASAVASGDDARGESGDSAAQNIGAQSSVAAHPEQPATDGLPEPGG